MNDKHDIDGAVALAAVYALSAIGSGGFPCAAPDSVKPYPNDGFPGKCKGRAYTKDDARARRKRIAKWRAKKKG